MPIKKSTTNIPKKDRTTLYYNYEVTTDCLFYKNYSDWFNYTKNKLSRNNWTAVSASSTKDEIICTVVTETHSDEFKPVKNHYLKHIRYNSSSEHIYKENGNIHVKFVQKIKIKTEDKKFFKTLIFIRHFIFNLKTNNFIHIRRKFSNRKWSSIIRINDFNIGKSEGKYSQIIYPLGMNEHSRYSPLFVKTLLISLNFDINTANGKIHEFNLFNLSNLLIQWFIQRNKINYDISPIEGLNHILTTNHNAPIYDSKYYYLVHNRPPKKIINKFKTYTEALIHYYKISNCDMIQAICEGEYYNLHYLSILNNLLPSNYLKFVNINLFKRKGLPKLRRKYKFTFNDFNEIEKSIIINRITYNPDWIYSFLLELEEFILLKKSSNYDVNFNCYDEIAAGTVFLLGKKETEKLRKKLKKRIIKK